LAQKNFPKGSRFTLGITYPPPKHNLSLKKEETGIAKKIEKIPAMVADFINRIWPMGKILTYPRLTNNN